MLLQKKQTYRLRVILPHLTSCRRITKSRPLCPHPQCLLVLASGCHHIIQSRPFHPHPRVALEELEWPPGIHTGKRLTRADLTVAVVVVVVVVLKYRVSELIKAPVYLAKYKLKVFLNTDVVYDIFQYVVIVQSYNSLALP